MPTIDSSPSNNGRGSHAWCRTWAHFSIESAVSATAA